jgi:sugar O-acyltransferase (sialic acid O-acetyltransferase NeuD family)
MRSVLILGAGRHGCNVAWVLQRSGRPIAGFLDDVQPAGAIVLGVPVLARTDDLERESRRLQADVAVAIGDNRARAVFGERAQACGACLATVIDPTALIAPDTIVGDGAFIGAFTRLSPRAELGALVIAEGHSILGCSARMEAFSSLGPGCQVTAGAVLERGAFLGAGAIACGPAIIGAWATVGAGAVVVRDVESGQRVNGVPARAVPA